MQDLRSFLNKLSHEYNIKIQNKLGDKIYYFNQHPQNAPTQIDGSKDFTRLPNNCVFTMKMFQTNRKFTNLFGPEISVVRKRVEFFTKNRKWYDSKGIPYTLGLLLSGQAGAGKTSSIKCLANETKRHIININLNNDITKIQLENLFFNEMIIVLNVSTSQTEKYFIPLDQRIYVLEDIDCQSELVTERKLKNIETESNASSKKDEISNQNSTSGAEKIDLSFLLNLLDGVLEIPGRIVVMTSNYPERLDHALIRPGRIDVIANFKKCSRETIIEMMEFFYDIKLDKNEKSKINELEDYFISPAEMSKLMFENFNDYKGSIDALKRFYENKKNLRIEKERKKEELKMSEVYENYPIDTSKIIDEEDKIAKDSNLHLLETTTILDNNNIATTSKDATSKNTTTIDTILTINKGKVINSKDLLKPEELFKQNVENTTKIFNPSEVTSSYLDLTSGQNLKYSKNCNGEPQAFDGWS
uniref:AAA+ ATPase domain-containing protein n=1 Tax=viral metagenome TaxID=1070528 RepID=A0A6C0KYD1_9ZZZZ